MVSEKQKRLEELMIKYPELERNMDICGLLSHIILLDNDYNDVVFEKLEAILKEQHSVGQKKIIKERYLYCEIPMDIDSKLYDECKKKGVLIPRFWRRTTA